MAKLILFACILIVTNNHVFSQQESDTTAIDDIDSYTGEEDESDGLIEGTFNSTRVINGHSTETLEKKMLEFRVEHRFGDMAGDQGGAQQMFGFDNVADIRLAFEYGITDHLMIGIGRSKGTGAPYRSLIDGFAKYKLLSQKKTGMPISLSVQGSTSFTYMKAVDDEYKVTHFPEWQHRLAYSLQMTVAKKFGKRLSLLLAPSMVHRNYVGLDDVNTLFAMGGAARFAVKPTMSIIVEYYHALADPNIRSLNTNSLGVAVEFETFGHVFTINLTNSKGFGETQFIPHTYSKWSQGQYRLGFTVGRGYTIGH